MKRISIAAAVAALALAGSAQAFEAYTDYTPSKEVWNVTIVKVNPNRIDDYLEGIRQTWVKGCRTARETCGGRCVAWREHDCVAGSRRDLA